MNKVIGIISYLPKDNLKRERRMRKLNNLLQQCDELFKLPIIIIAQNWNEFDIPKLNTSKLIIYKYGNPLGITEARRALRSAFINSDYDYLIMLDDDITLTGPKEGFEKYLQKIDISQPGYGLFKALTLQLFAISKELYKNIDFPKGDPSKGDFFEDMWLILALNKLYPSKRFYFDRNLINAVADASRDPDSTWYYGQMNKHHIGNNTRAMIGELKC